MAFYNFENEDKWGEYMYCPRCGAEMKNGVCDECGFPMLGKRRLITYVLTLI